jgi:small subunit ribosomal protein S17
MDKTAVVEMVWKQRHIVYSKQMRRVARFYVHDPESRCQVGDTVRIEETRPISRTKHWRLLEILQHRQMADISPIELETEITPVMTGEALAEAPPRVQPGEVGSDLDEDTEE